MGNLIRMQIIDNLLVVHNLDSKSSQIYDFKIVDYATPLLKAGLQVDSSTLGKYVSDMFLPEELASAPPVAESKEEKKESSDSDDKAEKP